MHRNFDVIHQHFLLGGGGSQKKRLHFDNVSIWYPVYACDNVCTAPNSNSTSNTSTQISSFVTRLVLIWHGDTVK